MSVIGQVESCCAVIGSWVALVSGVRKGGSLNRGISNEGSKGNQHNWFFIIRFRNSIEVNTI